MKKNIIILGPTASGKTHLSIEISRKFNLPIINMDTRQFWKDIRILTASPSEKELESANHVLFNEQNENFFPSLGWWSGEIQKMTFDNKILVGGNAFYANNLRRGIPNYKTYNDNTQYTWNDLYELDKNTTVHKNDFYRIQRQVLFLKHNKCKYSEFNNKYSESCFVIAIIPSKEILKQRIENRSEKLIENSIIEIKNTLHSENYNNIIGYKQIRQYINNEIQYDELVNTINLQTYQYAKKQCKFLKSIHIDYTANTHILTNELCTHITEYLYRN